MMVRMKFRKIDWILLKTNQIEITIGTSRYFCIPMERMIDTRFEYFKLLKVLKLLDHRKEISETTNTRKNFHINLLTQMARKLLSFFNISILR